MPPGVPTVVGEEPRCARAAPADLSGPRGTMTFMPVPGPAERVDLPIVCTCGAVRAAAGDALYHRVKERPSHGSRHLRPRTVTDRSSVDDLVLSLSPTMARPSRGSSTTSGRRSLSKPDHPARRQVVLQCDEVALGLAAIWEWFEQRNAQEAP